MIITAFVVLYMVLITVSLMFMHSCAKSDDLAEAANEKWLAEHGKNK